MKTDKSIRNITIAAMKRSSMNMESWNCSYISNLEDDKLRDEFGLENEEIPVFEIKSESAHTLITTRKIIEKSSKGFKSVDFDQIDDVIYGNFKGHPNIPELTKFRIIDFFGDDMDFQMETGKASMGLIYSINTIRKLIAGN